MLARKLTSLPTLLMIACLVLSGPASAQFDDVTVLTEFVVDPLIGGGGYFELTVINNGEFPVRAVAIGENSSEVVYIAPALIGAWSPRRTGPEDWDAGDVFSDYGFYIPPKTEQFPWNTYFGPGYGQALAWQSQDPGGVIGPGETLTGFRYLSGVGAVAHGGLAREDPMPFAVFDEAGDLTASGFTMPAGSVPTAAHSFGSIKSLFGPSARN